MKKKQLIKSFEQKELDCKKKYKKLCRSYDTNNIHDFRVSTRRLSSFYSFLLFAGYTKNKKIKKRIKILFKILGEIRDYQVNLILLSNLYFVNNIPEDISEIFNIKIAEKEKELLDLLKRDRLDISDLLKKDKKNVKRFLKNMKKKEIKLYIERLYEKLKNEYAENTVIKNYEVDSLHILRISAKKYRYFLENFGEFLDWDYEAELKKLKMLQEQLGDINDLVVLKRNLNEFMIDLQDNKDAIIEVRLQNKIKEFKINF